MKSVLDRLVAASGDGIRVAIVDSGVEATHPWLGGRLEASYLAEATGERLTSVEAADVAGHGTAIAGQVRRFAPDASFISVRILDERISSSSEQLLSALLGLRDFEIHVVVMSLSTQNRKLALEIGQAIDELYGRGVFCACARGYHKTGRAYPTDFAGVVAVTYAEQPMARLVFQPRNHVNFVASGVGIEAAWRDGKTRQVTGSSFACPAVAGLAARMLSIERSLEPFEIATALKEYAARQEDGWWADWMSEVDQPPLKAADSPSTNESSVVRVT